MSKTKTLVAAALLASVIPAMALALPPTPAFKGKVLDIFMNDTQVLVQVEGGVKGTCTGAFANYNLTFDFADAQSQTKLALIRDAFLHGKIIAGSVSGCGSSNINKLHQFAIANP
ncbi:hypothetical protein NR798_44495 [Archangium gephyra]|uniref:hypothetical protein n=1 Tax=Archangium gephyra TaxID=48 RepID=UPI0035D482DB